MSRLSQLERVPDIQTGEGHVQSHVRVGDIIPEQEPVLCKALFQNVHRRIEGAVSLLIALLCLGKPAAVHRVVDVVEKPEVLSIDLMPESLQVQVRGALFMERPESRLEVDRQPVVVIVHDGRTVRCLQVDECRNGRPSAVVIVCPEVRF